MSNTDTDLETISEDIFSQPLANVAEVRFTSLAAGKYVFHISDINKSELEYEEKKTGDKVKAIKLDLTCTVNEVVALVSKLSNPDDNLGKNIDVSFFIPVIRGGSKVSPDEVAKSMGVITAFLHDITGTKVETSLAEFLPTLENVKFQGEVYYPKNSTYPRLKMSKDSLKSL